MKPTKLFFALAVAVDGRVKMTNRFALATT